MRAGTVLIVLVAVSASGDQNPAAGVPGDPYYEFFRRFMREAPQGGAPEARGQGLGSSG